MHKDWKPKITNFQSYSDRIAKLSVKIDERIRMTLIQVYAPTTLADKVEIQKFFEDVSQVIKESGPARNHYLLVLGDFNSQIGVKNTGEKRWIGNYTYGKRNKNGNKLVQLCQENNLKIVNTIFKKKEG